MGLKRALLWGKNAREHSLAFNLSIAPTTPGVPFAAPNRQAEGHCMQDADAPFLGAKRFK